MTASRPLWGNEAMHESNARTHGIERVEHGAGISRHRDLVVAADAAQDVFGHCSIAHGDVQRMEPVVAPGDDDA